MNVLITGGNGFLARGLFRSLQKHNVYSPSHQQLDVWNRDALQSFIDSAKINVVIHTAIRGGRRTQLDEADVFYHNVLMFENVAYCASGCDLIINFGSGAEFDRRISIDNVREEDVVYKTPFDYYGLSKNIIARRIMQIENAVNLRIFNCFGFGEADTRFITSAIKNNPLVIDFDRQLDFFYILDLCSVVNFYLDSLPNIPFKDINCVYNDKYALSEIAELMGSRFFVQDKGILNYTGNGEKLSSLPIQMRGLEQGISETKLLSREHPKF